MPKKKPVIFQNSIPGKFIPRNSSAPGSVFPSGANDNRYNAKIAQLLASSPSPSSLIDENELASRKSSQENVELSSNESSCIHSKLFHRRIVTMIETLRKPTQDLPPISIPSPYVEQKSRPITFGQLRQATMSSTMVAEEKSVYHLSTVNTGGKPVRTFTSYVRDNELDAATSAVKSSTKPYSSKERLYYSPSLEKLFEEQNAMSQSKQEAVDQIPVSSSSTTNVANHLEPMGSFSIAPKSNTSFYMRPSVPQWNASQSNQQIVPPPLLLLNQHNPIRPPPPSYSSSVASSPHIPLTVPNRSQSLIRPSSVSAVFEYPHPPPSIMPHLPAGTLSLPFSSSSSPSLSTLMNPTGDSSPRPAPPRYQLPMSTVEPSQPISSSLSKSNLPTSTQQSKPVSNSYNNNNSFTGFDRAFSRLLYGKDPAKTRRKKQRRKAFSDPVKECVEEARRTLEKGRRRVTTHLNKSDSVDEDDDDDEVESSRSMNYKYDLNLPPRRRVHRQTANIPSVKKAIVPANPLLKQRIPSFLRVYSQASPSTDILLQWHLFNLSELESFYAMITRLYKSENLARVQLYEIYRSALLSALASKTPVTTDDEKSATTSTL